jgi:hypothetical protein
MLPLVRTRLVSPAALHNATTVASTSSRRTPERVVFVTLGNISRARFAGFDFRGVELEREAGAPRGDPRLIMESDFSQA